MNKKIHKDENGREFIKESYFLGGKMKFRRIYVIDGIPADEFYEENATDLNFFINEDYHLMKSENELNNNVILQNDIEFNENDNLKDLPF
ncbi:MAG: hypothetical protein LAT51_13100 [Flavobacteriaceae bacterium]|nr:hypothetical protein [Flavobacteriaceae bacterium]